MKSQFCSARWAWYAANWLGVRRRKVSVLFPFFIRSMSPSSIEGGTAKITECLVLIIDLTAKHRLKRPSEEYILSNEWPSCEGPSNSALRPISNIFVDGSWLKSPARMMVESSGRSWISSSVWSIHEIRLSVLYIGLGGGGILHQCNSNVPPHQV